MTDTTFVTATTLPGVLQIKRPTFADDRGFFRESFRLSELQEKLNSPFTIVQANHARSSKGTLRGIHIAPWNKLIYVTRGKVQAVIVDMRKESSTFGKYESFLLGDDNRISLFIPAHYGNSYLVLSDEADYTYLTDQEWQPHKEYGVAWNDPSIGVKWEISEQLNLSDKDQQNPTLNSLFPEKF